MTDTKKPPPCYASQHLHPREYALWEVSMRLTSGGKRTLSFDGRSMAKRFTGISKDYIYRAVKLLVLKGWFSPLNGAGRKMNKDTRRYEATQYHVLSHSEWVSVHGSSHCASRADETGPFALVRQEPVAESDGTIRKMDQVPVAPVRHNPVVSLVKDSCEGGSIGETTYRPLNTEVQNQPRPPTRDDLARSLLDNVGLPVTRGNLEVVIASIAVEAKHVTDEKAFAIINKAAEVARASHDTIDAFWFQDGKWHYWK